MLTCKDIPMRPNSLHRAKRITSICAICINVQIELIFSRFKLDVQRTSFEPVPFSDTSLITSSHILYSMSTGFSDGKARFKKILLLGRPVVFIDN